MLIYVDDDEPLLVQQHPPPNLQKPQMNAKMNIQRYSKPISSVIKVLFCDTREGLKSKDFEKLDQEEQ